MAAAMMKYLVQVEEEPETAPQKGGTLLAGPAYRCAAGGGEPPSVPGLESWDIFRYGCSISFILFYWISSSWESEFRSC
jgi:hypothetical protein